MISLEKKKYSNISLKSVKRLKERFQIISLITSNGYSFASYNFSPTFIAL